MKQLFKQESMKEIVRYNQRLLIICVLLAVTSLLLAFKTFTSSETWVLVPAVSPDKRMTVSSKGYSKIYLQEWATYIMQTLMTTSSHTIDAQVSELKVISGNSHDIARFLSKHIEFVKGSNIQSVFFPKKVEFQKNAVLVSGLFKYWLGSSEKPISQEKTYRLTYKRGPKNILLLNNVTEVTKKETS